MRPGAAAWQTVFHFHTHVVPRYRADELRLMWRPEPAPAAELAALRGPDPGRGR